MNESKRYIHSKLFDSLFFIGCPLITIVLAWIMSQGIFQKEFDLWGETNKNFAFYFYVSLMMGHVLATVFRTHANTAIFNQYKWRFTVIPICVWLFMVTSEWFFALATVVLMMWDVYHSCFQTFGFGRIYDKLAGNDVTLGRRADLCLNVVMYAGPIFGGALLGFHMESFRAFEELEALSLFGMTIDPTWLASIEQKTLSHAGEIRIGVYVVALGVLSYYCMNMISIYKKGYRLPVQKLCLYLSTLITVILAFWRNQFFLGMFIVNLFHAVQYFAILWVSDKASIKQVLGGGKTVIGFWWQVLAFVSIPSILGLLLSNYSANVYVGSLLVVCGLMHFWYDAFIWSVRSSKTLVGTAKSKS